MYDSSGRWERYFEDIPIYGVCHPACHDSSFGLFVLVRFLEAVVLPLAILRSLQHFPFARCSRNVRSGCDL